MEYAESSCRLFRDRSNEDYSKLKIYKLRSSKCDKVYIGMCSNELDVELEWIKEEYIFWTYGGGYVKRELYDMLSMGGVLSMELIRYVDGCKIFNDGLESLNEVLKLYIDEGKCVNSRLWCLPSDKLSDIEKKCVNLNKYKKKEYYLDDMSEEDKLINKRLEEQNYSYGKIYKICSDNSELCYIGSTVRSLEDRLLEHKEKYKNYKEGKSKDYMSSYDIIEKGDISIVLLEKYSCNSKEELLSKEGKYINEYGSKCVNKIEPCGKRGKEYLKVKCELALKEDILDYKNSMIFRMKSNKSGRYMIGISVKSLDEMLKLYMGEYEKFKYGKLKTKKMYYDIIMDGDVVMELVENVSCNSLKELKEREKLILKDLKGDDKCINKDFKIKLL